MRVRFPSPAPSFALVSALHRLPSRNLDEALRRAVIAAKAIFGATGAGLMLIDLDGTLRWATASDAHVQEAERGQERLAQGPCQVAFAVGRPAAMRDARLETDWGEIASFLRSVEIRAALSVPVQIDGSPIGTLDVYSDVPRQWDDSEISVIQTYAALVANLLLTGVAAHIRGRLAEQPQTALDHRTLIEQAKGILMQQQGLSPDAAFDQLRRSARSLRRTVGDLAQEIIAKVPLPPVDSPPPRDGGIGKRH